MNTKNSQQHLLDESEVLIALAAQKGEIVEKPPSSEELADFFCPLAAFFKATARSDTRISG